MEEVFQPTEIVRVFSIEIQERHQRGETQASEIEKALVADLEVKELQRKNRIRHIDNYLNSTRSVKSPHEWIMLAYVAERLSALSLLVDVKSFKLLQQHSDRPLNSPADMMCKQTLRSRAGKMSTQSWMASDCGWNRNKARKSFVDLRNSCGSSVAVSARTPQHCKCCQSIMTMFLSSMELFLWSFRSVLSRLLSEQVLICARLLRVILQSWKVSHKH